MSNRDDARTAILRSIRQSLDASIPHDLARAAVHEAENRPRRSVGIPLPLAPEGARTHGAPPPDLDATPTARFCAQLEAVGGRWAVAASPAEASRMVRTLLTELSAERVALSDAPEARAVVDPSAEDGPTFLTSASQNEMFAVDAGISSAQWGVAETGTLVLESCEERHRLVSLVPPVHIALLRADRICATLDEAMGRLKRDGLGLQSRAVTFITGPSRTADIEQMLVVGVHGPQILVVIVIEGDASDGQDGAVGSQGNHAINDMSHGERMMAPASPQETSGREGRSRAGAEAREGAWVRFMTLEPGHFHAALVQKSMYPTVLPEVDVYSSPGADLDAHLKRIEGFNSRPANPTSWNLRVLRGPQAFEGMLSAPSGNVVVIAGRNRPKIDYVVGAIEHGLNLLVDKPWIIRSEDLPRLEAALDAAESRGIVAFDIMTERFEVTNALQRVLVNDPEIFGSIEAGSAEDPAVYMKSVHHIVKEAAGASLWRPAWFFDIVEQGEALADVGTHLVDLSLWALHPDTTLDFRKDVRLNGARRWPTVITRQQFRDVTGEAEFPAALSPWVDGDELRFFANTSVEYELRGVHVKLEALWDRQSPVHGDTHHAVYRGDRSRIEVRQGEAEGWIPEVYVIPNRAEWKDAIADALRRRVAALQDRWEGLAVEAGESMRLTIPPRHRLGHEAHFAEVTAEFLSYLQEPVSFPAWEKSYMSTKYAITTAGTDLSRAGREAPGR